MARPPRSNLPPTQGTTQAAAPDSPGGSRHTQPTHLPAPPTNLVEPNPAHPPRPARPPTHLGGEVNVAAVAGGAVVNDFDGVPLAAGAAVGALHLDAPAAGAVELEVVHGGKHALKVVFQAAKAAGIEAGGVLVVRLCRGERGGERRDGSGRQRRGPLESIGSRIAANARGRAASGATRPRAPAGAGASGWGATQADRGIQRGSAAFGSKEAANWPGKVLLQRWSDITWRHRIPQKPRRLPKTTHPIPSQLTRVGGGIAGLRPGKGHKGAQCRQEDECLASHGCSSCSGTGRGLGMSRCCTQGQENGERMEEWWPGGSDGGHLCTPPQGCVTTRPGLTTLVMT